MPNECAIRTAYLGVRRIVGASESDVQAIDAPDIFTGHQGSKAFATEFFFIDNFEELTGATRTAAFEWFSSQSGPCAKWTTHGIADNNVALFGSNRR
jgi:hypothetical protein